ncbi:MAG: LON peptidase substrate-binding domain-containing protein [Planctomycetes bacterium]|nr:LON peptidase substrate-binding domain-containing protein [Planctomycetota bacterium]
MDEQSTRRTLLPLFPLPNVVLFPGTTILLHIFEQRYRAMTAYAFEHDEAIGLVLPRPGWEPEYEGCPPVHPIACLGRIKQHERLPDGRYNLALAGVARARIVEEVAQSPFRLARVEIVGDQEPGPGDGVWETCVRMVSFYAEVAGTPELKEKLIESLAKPPFVPGAVTDRIVAMLPLEPEDKQELLAALEVPARMERALHFLKITKDQRDLVARMGRFRPSKLSNN